MKSTVANQQDRALTQWNSLAVKGVSPSFKDFLELHRWLDDPRGDIARDWITLCARSPRRLESLLASIHIQGSTPCNEAVTAAIELWNRYVEAAGLPLGLQHSRDCKKRDRKPCSCRRESPLNRLLDGHSTRGVPFVFLRWEWHGEREGN